MVANLYQGFTAFLLIPRFHCLTSEPYLATGMSTFRFLGWLKSLHEPLKTAHSPRGYLPVARLLRVYC